MTSMELLELLGSVSDKYVLDAYARQTEAKRHLSLRKPLLVAALITLSLLLVGCTYAYVQGWFTDFFAARSEEPLSSEQVEFIQENEQIILETQVKGDWMVELKSAITDGETGYVMFGVTAPADIDLEGYHAGNYGDAYVTPGNNSWGRNAHRALIVDSTGWAHEEENYCWQEGGYWQADNDRKSNTLNYVIKLRWEKLYPDREMLAENPFGDDAVFTVTFDDFTLEYTDPEVQKKIDEKYAGMTDYMVDTEDLVGLHKSELLADGEWKFTIPFKTIDSEPVELITQPTMTWALVTWKLDDEPMFYKTGSGLEAVKITSFLLNPFGATVTFDFEEPAIGAFIEYQSMFGYTDRNIYAVMKDGSQIALHTDSIGTQFQRFAFDSQCRCFGIAQVHTVEVSGHDCHFLSSPFCLSLMNFCSSFFKDTIQPSEMDFNS